MALLKKYKLPHNGTVGNYWRIDSVKKDYRSDTCTVVISLFATEKSSKSKNALQAEGVRAIMQKHITGVPLSATAKGDDRKNIYAALKKMEHTIDSDFFFSDSTDC